jgi:tetratricopeptide (TPR) repeat protein
METIKLKQPALVFYSYDDKDRELRDELDKHLTTLKHQQLIKGWHDRDISAGTEWKSVADKNLNAAQIILLLISADFIASEYRYSFEMKRALERHNSGDTFVLPVLLRSCDINGPPFDQLDFLPGNMKAITSWHNSDEAFQDVAKGIRYVVEELIPRTREQWLDEGITYRRTKHYEKALVACERALRLDRNYARAHRNKGDTLYELERYTEAVNAYTLALDLDPTSARTHQNMANTLYHLGQHNTSLDAYDRALQLAATPTSRLWRGKGDALFYLRRYKEALQAYEQAVRLEPDSADTYYNKGNALLCLECYQEAIVAYEQAIQLQPTFALSYNNKGRALFYLGRYEEAHIAYECALRLDPKLAKV